MWGSEYISFIGRMASGSLRRGEQSGCVGDEEMSTTQEDERYWAVVRFKYPETVYEHMVAAITSGAVHCDILFCCAHEDGLGKGVFTIGDCEDGAEAEPLEGADGKGGADGGDCGGEWVASEASLAKRVAEVARSEQKKGVAIGQGASQRQADADGRRFAFTAYMKQPFSIYFTDRDSMNNDKYKNLYVTLTSEEYRACTSYLGNWVERALPYNYSDTMFGIPAVHPGSDVAASIFEDVDGSDPNRLRTVYCSQAVVLVLRQCLNARGHNKDLVKILHGLNSRLVSPEVLYKNMFDNAHVISNSALFSGIVS